MGTHFHDHFGPMWWWISAIPNLGTSQPWVVHSTGWPLSSLCPSLCPAWVAASCLLSTSFLKKQKLKLFFYIRVCVCVLARVHACVCSAVYLWRSEVSLLEVLPFSDHVAFSDWIQVVNSGSKHPSRQSPAPCLRLSPSQLNCQFMFAEKVVATGSHFVVW